MADTREAPMFHIFQPSLPARGATVRGFQINSHVQFQPSLPARGATRFRRGRAYRVKISTLAPREGSDLQDQFPQSVRCVFQPSLPARGATGICLASGQNRTYFNPRSPRGERPVSVVMMACPAAISTLAPREGSDDDDLHLPGILEISTLAPREGSDTAPDQRDQSASNFNPRSPRGERHRLFHRFVGRGGFQPSLPARGATASISSMRLLSRHFNPRSPRGERLWVSGLSTTEYGFQPSLPARGATRIVLKSIAAIVYFNPRSPRGERLAEKVKYYPMHLISTLAPREGSDICSTNVLNFLYISTLAPREGSDLSSVSIVSTTFNFNPRSPRGERHFD